MSITPSGGRLRDPVMLPVVHHSIRDFMGIHDGIALRRDLIGAVDHRVLERAVRDGDLVSPFPRTYVDPARTSDLDDLCRAAIAYADGAAVLSHTSALRVWGLPVPDTGVIHLSTDQQSHLRGAKGLLVHRRKFLESKAPDAVIRNGLPVTRLEPSIVDSWPILDKDAKRAPAIVAMSNRMTRPDRLAATLESYPRLAGRRHLADLIELFAAGCRSHLELWGYRHVFGGPEFASLKWQFPVRINNATVYLDALDPASGVNLELDGFKYHGSRTARERDMRRDNALAALGITVIRHSHDMLTRQPMVARYNTLKAMTSRPPGWVLPATAIV